MRAYANQPVWMRQRGRLRRSLRLMIAALLLPMLIFPAAPVSAAVVRMQVDRREPFADGHRFGRSGAYEILAGSLFIEVDPQNDANARIADLSRAPRNPQGRVAFRTDFHLLKPVDPTRGNRRLLYGVNNRGNKLLLGAFNDRGGNDPKTLSDAGNGFLMRQGYTILWCGWNGDVLPGNGRLMIDLPVATENGRTITGRIYAEIVVDRPVKSQPFYWGNSNPYPSVSLDNSTARLTMRPHRQAPAVEVPHDRWAFARLEDGKVIPDAKHLYIKEGFRPGWIYELVYTGRDPRVTGLGFAAVRDAVSFFRYESADADGTRNPLADSIERAIVFGISQSGRFIHHFLFEGFNRDEQNRMVFDAAFAHVGGGGKGQFNFRFAQTTRHGSQHEDNLFPSDFFPFTSVPQTDPVTGARGDILARLRQSGHVPKIFFTETSTEYWCRAASLLHTDVAGTRDIAPDPHVRIYFIAGAQHGVSSSPKKGIYQYERNTLDHRPVLRALLVALDEWASGEKEPPESVLPRIADGTLVDLETYRKQFPAIPGVEPPRVLYEPLRLDPGPRWLSEGISDYVPPKVGAAYRTLVPAVDADGNERAGIRLPDVAVPVATYTGWNLRAEPYGAAGMLGRWSGAQFPFAVTPEQRRQRGDPRLSIRERYPTRETYLAQIAEAALSLRQRGFLLDEDVVRILERAGRRDFWSKPQRP